MDGILGIAQENSKKENCKITGIICCSNPCLQVPSVYEALLCL